MNEITNLFKTQASVPTFDAEMPDYELAFDPVMVSSTRDRWAR